MARRISGGRGIPVPTGGPVRPRRGDLPDRESLIGWLRDNPGESSKRDIAKAFGIKGDDRVILKAMIRELASEGVLRKEGSKLIAPGGLPPVAAVDIFSRDKDGSLIARPVEWDETNGAPPLITIAISKRDKTAVPGVGERVLAKLFRNDHGEGYVARIIKKLDKRAGAILGVFRELPTGELRVEPVERKQVELTVDPDFRNGAKDGDLVEIEAVRVGRYGIARAKVLSVAGSLKSEKAVSLIAIHMHGIPHIFPQSVLDAAAAAKPATMHGREDWRSVPLVTIDPADAKDHDDAVYAEPDADEDNVGGYIITVAIADVAAYIHHGTALDREALKRGNSTYFPDRVVPMLPERISNDLCSLREGEDRPALAVRMVVSKEGKKLRHTFHRVMMRSNAKLSYPQAQAAIDGATDAKTAPILDSVLKPLWSAYGVLKRERTRREPLDLDLPERKILLNPDGTVDKIIIPDRLDAHRLIEEMMILANVATAETLEAKNQPLVYRVHDQPSLAKQESLREFLRTLNIPLAKGVALKSKDFNNILSQVRGSVNETLVNEVVLRSQSQAIYSPENLGHFGLHLRRYAHFTSPIRRYSDLIAHRALIKALGLGPDGITQAEVEALEVTAGLISTSERKSMAAERDTIDRLIANHLKDRIGDTFDGRISGVVGAGLFVTLPAYGADGFVPVSTLSDDYYHFVENSRALVAEKSGLGYRLGDKVEVRLTDVQVYAGSIRYEMVSLPAPLSGLPQSFHKAKRGLKRGSFSGGRKGPKRR